MRTMAVSESHSVGCLPCPPTVLLASACSTCLCFHQVLVNIETAYADNEALAPLVTAMARSVDSFAQLT